MRNWDNLRVFLALARAGSPDGAGRTLRLDESTVRRRLAALEREIGASLIEKVEGAWRCTRAGAGLLAAAESIEGEIMAAEAQLDGADPSLAGTVRIGAPDGYGSHVVVPVLAHLQRRAPELLIELVTHGSPADISRREVDVLIATQPPDSGRFRIRRLRPVTLMMHASREYLARNGEIRSLDDLHRHRMIGYDPAADYADAAVRRLERLGVAMRPGFACSTVLGQARAASAGAGLALLPTYMVDPSLDLVPVLADEIAISLDLWLLVHADVARRGRVRAVMEAIAGA